MLTAFYMSFDEAVKKDENGILQIRFFTLSDKAIKFKLRVNNESNIVDDETIAASSWNDFDIWREYAFTIYYTTTPSTTTNNYERNLNVLKPSSDNDYYEFGKFTMSQFE